MAACGIQNSACAQNSVIALHRWSRTATDGLTGSRGTPVTVTWSVIRDGQTFSNFNSSNETNLIDFLDTQWSVDNGSSTSFESRPWFVPLQASIQRWSELAGITFEYESNDSGEFGLPGAIGVRGDIRIGGSSNRGVAAAAFFPDNGELFVNTNQMLAFDPDSSNNNLSFRNIFSHEIGHSLGLSHLLGQPSLLNPILPTAFDGPQFHDILAMQRSYGDALEKNGGNDTFATATSLGTIPIDGKAQIGMDSPDIGGNAAGILPNQTDFVSIDDNDDTDFFKFSVTSRSEASFLLDPRGPVYIVGVQVSALSRPNQEFNGSQRSDLALAIFDANGVQLSLLDLTSAGDNELVNRFQLPEPGEYFARITGRDDDTQMYSFSVAVDSSSPIADPNIIMQDDFTSGGVTRTDINYSRPSDARQGTSVVNAQLVAGTTDSANASVLLVDDQLSLNVSTDGSSSTNLAFVDLNRNFLPQLDGQTWEVRFDLNIDADAGINNELFSFVFNDDFDDDDDLAIQLRANGDVTASAGEFNQTTRVFSADNTYQYRLLVDETGNTAYASLFINETLVVDRQAFTLEDTGRYFGFRSQVSNSTLGFDALVDNFEIRLTSPVLLGDVNLDGIANFMDISPFVTILALSGFQTEADINRDDTVDFLDISPFIALLSSQ